MSHRSDIFPNQSILDFPFKLLKLETFNLSTPTLLKQGPQKCSILIYCIYECHACHQTAIRQTTLSLLSFQNLQTSQQHFNKIRPFILLYDNRQEKKRKTEGIDQWLDVITYISYPTAYKLEKKEFENKRCCYCVYTVYLRKSFIKLFLHNLLYSVLCLFLAKDFWFKQLTHKLVLRTSQ